jgi:hypothetical protein
VRAQSQGGLESQVGPVGTPESTLVPGKRRQRGGWFQVDAVDVQPGIGFVAFLPAPRAGPLRFPHCAVIIGDVVVDTFARALARAGFLAATRFGAAFFFASGTSRSALIFSKNRALHRR